MNKQSKPIPDDGGDFGPELSEAEMDAWFERNREALNLSLQAAREGLARGEVDTRTFAEIIAEGTRRHLAKR
jgi:hypothetical protein